MIKGFRTKWIQDIELKAKKFRFLIAYNFCIDKQEERHYRQEDVYEYIYIYMLTSPHELPFVPSRKEKVVEKIK